jgi:hypothetical protein
MMKMMKFGTIPYMSKNIASYAQGKGDKPYMFIEC